LSFDQGTLEYGGQSGQGNRFFEVFTDARIAQALAVEVGTETAGEDDGHVRADTANLTGQFQAVHFRHGQVSDDEIELERVLTEQFDRFTRTVAGGDRVMQLAQQSLKRRGQGRFIIHN